MSFSNSSFKQTLLFPSTGSSNKQPKSPKSPKVAIENPLLKNPQFMMAPSLISEPALLQSNNRSPLRSLLSNSQQPKTRMKLAMTPGPPPKASLSLTGMAPMTQPATPVGSKPSPMEVVPAPVSSPTMFQHKEATPINVTARPTNTSNWVIAYGYTNDLEYDELFGVLRSHGSIKQQKSNANWLAVQYDNQFSAAKALCNQPIQLPSSSALCGTVGANQQLLQGLLSQPQTSATKDNLFSLIAETPTLPSTSASTTSRQPQSASPLREEDILAAHEDEIIYRRPSSSICDKVLDWYFGWNEETHHPHSD